MYARPIEDEDGGGRRILRVDNLEFSTLMLARRHRMISLRGIISGWPLQLGNGMEAGRKDEHSPVRVVDDLLAMNLYDPKAPITLIVDSPGGSVDMGMIVYDAIKLSAAPVRTIGVSCASMATLLLAAGAERLAFPHSRFMLHLPRGSFSSVDPKDAKIQADELDRVNEMLIGCYIECGVTAGLLDKTPKQIRQKINKDINREYWMDSDEAIKYGLIDRVITREELFGNGN